MKLSVLAASALATIAAFGADVTSIETSNTFGVMKVTCSAQKAIVCTPWVKAVTAGDIPLKDLVMTAGLDNGDAIILYKDGEFKGWTLNGGAWVGTAVAGVDGTVLTGDNEAIMRGAGFWFVKSNFTADYDLYLYGQDKETSATSEVVANAYNLLANPTTVSVNVASKIASAANGDSIQIPGGILYTYNGTNWTYLKKEVVNGRNKVTAATASEINIPAGQGFWYVSKGGSGTIAW